VIRRGDQNFVRAPNRAGAIKSYGRTKNDASATETAGGICSITPGRKYSDGREQGWCPKRREEIGDHPGGTAIWWNARRRALTPQVRKHTLVIA
jgi:hypothetical protein